jgi:dihydroorotase
VSSALGVAAIRRAKAEGVPVTASVPSLNLVLDDEVVLQSGYDTDTRLLPPLRGSVDREALVAAVRDGTIDAVGSGHRPLTRVDKDLEFDAAVPGASTLETALSSTLEACGLLAALRALSSGPAGILGLDRRLAPGAVADLVLLDPEARWRVAPERFASKGRNTPLKGRELPGVVRGLVRGDRMARPATPAP